MISAAAKAFSEMLTRPFRPVLLRSVGLTVALFVVVFLAVQGGIAFFLPFVTGWIETTLEVFAGLALIVGFVFFAAPITALVASLFLDDIAEAVERRDYPGDPPGTPLSIVAGILQAIRFFGVVLAVNIVALMLLLIPGVNIIAFLLANAFLLGREYFELCALRHMPAADMRELRRRNSGQLFLAGLVIAGFLAVPILNFLTPVFATCFMMHVFKDLEGEPVHQPV